MTSHTVAAEHSSSTAAQFTPGAQGRCKSGGVTRGGDCSSPGTMWVRLPPWLAHFLLSLPLLLALEDAQPTWSPEWTATKICGCTLPATVRLTAAISSTDLLHGHPFSAAGFLLHQLSG